MLTYSRHWSAAVAKRGRILIASCQRRDLQSQSTSQAIENPVQVQDSLGLRGHHSSGEFGANLTCYRL